MGKQIWALAAKEDSLWVKWIHERYLKDNNIWECTAAQSANWHWKKLMKIRDFLLPGFHNDKWLHTGNGIYTATSGYKWMLGSLNPFPLARALWSNYNIPKYSFTCWLVAHGRLLTKDRLVNWNILIEDDSCALCNRETESIGHLFFKCQYSRDLCRLLAKWIRVRTIPVRGNDWKHWLIQLAGQKQLKAKICISSVTALIAMIWKERNARTHGRGSRTVEQCFFKLKQDVKLRVLSRVAGEEKKALAKQIMQMS